MNIRLFTSLYDLFSGSTNLTIRHILGNRSGEQKHILGHQTDMFAQCIHIPFSKIVPINTVLPGLWIIKTKQNLHNGRLTSTRITDKCHIAAPFYGQANILQNLLFF